MKTKLYKFKKAISNKKGDASYVSVVIVMFVILVFFATFLGYWHTNQKIELTEENIQLTLDNYLMDHYSDLYEPLANGGKDSKMTEETYKRTFQSIFDKLNVETIAKYMEKNSPYTITNDKDNITAYDTEGDVAFKLNDISLSYKLDSKYANGNGEVNFQPKLIADYKVETVINLALVKPTINYSTESFSSYKLKYVNEYDDNGTKKAESDNNTPDLSNKTAKYTLHYNDNKTANLSDNYKPSEVKKLPIPRRTNYTFAGWYRSTVLSGATYSSTPSTYEGDVDYYAKWVNSYHEISNEVKVTFSYYDVADKLTVAAGDLNSTPTTYSYTYDGLPGSCFDYYGKDNQKINFSKVIKYAAANTHDPDNCAHSYYYWTSQAEAEEGIQTLPDYHSTPTTNSDGEWVYENYSKQIYHPDTYGNPQTSGEKFVTYYDNEGNEIPESDIYEQNANISEIKVWYVNTLKKFKVTAHIVNEDTSEFEENSKGLFVGTKRVVIPNIFYQNPLGEINELAEKFGVKNITPDLITKEKFVHNNKTYYFQYWSHDKEGNGVTATNNLYTLRISYNETLYAIYSTSDLKKLGLNTLNPVVNKSTMTDGTKSFSIGGVITPYNFPNNDENILKVATIFTKDKSNIIDNCSQNEYLKFKNNIITELNAGKYGEGTTQVTKFTIQPSNNQVYQNELRGSALYCKGFLSNYNRILIGAKYTEDSLKDQTIYMIQALYYDKINPLTGEKYGWILSDNTIKFKFDTNCNYDITSIQH